MYGTTQGVPLLRWLPSQEARVSEMRQKAHDTEMEENQGSVNFGETKEKKSETKKNVTPDPSGYGSGAFRFHE